MGKPTVTICTNIFEPLARITSKSLGMPSLCLVVTTHPIGGLKPGEVTAKANDIIEEIITSLTGTQIEVSPGPVKAQD